MRSAMTTTDLTADYADYTDKRNIRKFNVEGSNVEGDPGDAFAVDGAIEPEGREGTDPGELDALAFQQTKTITYSNVFTHVADGDYAGVSIEGFDQEGTLNGLSAKLDGGAGGGDGFLTRERHEGLSFVF